MIGEIGYFDDPADANDKCTICGAEPMTVNCNNANCWTQTTDDERTDDED